MLLALAVASTGCNRSFYRQQADNEVYGLVQSVPATPLWSMPNFTIQPDPRARFFDPYNPDCEPMPPDDPYSHQLMHYVDHMRGYPCWHKCGDTPYVENPSWLAYVPFDEQGQVEMDLDSSVEIARLQSRDYQSQLEQLYLSALDVTFERFRFDAQFFGGNSTFYTADGRVRGGGRSRSILNTDNALEMRKLNAAGGELLVGFANSFVWQFSSNDTYTANSLLNFNIIQPLLRGAGRARVLERLTFSERVLLANIRQMEQWRRGFYVEVTTGRDAGSGPSRRGGFFGGAGLEGFTGVGSGGFGRVGGFGGGGLQGGGFTGGAGAAQAGGFIGLLQSQREIDNRRANVVALRDSLAQLEAAYDAGRIDRFQVDLARQALYNAQSQLINSEAALQSTLDGFKVVIGLPPALPVRINDPMLDRFNLIDPRLTAVQDAVGRLLDELRNPDPAAPLPQWEPLLPRLADAQSLALSQLEIVRNDLEILEQSLSERRLSLEKLAQRGDVIEDQFELDAFSIAALDRRATEIRKDVESLAARIEAQPAALAELRDQGPGADPRDFQTRLIAYLTDLSGNLLELSLVQARARLDSFTLVPVEMDETTAMQIASENRRDWMNARASLVDTWRLIEFNANDLLAGLNLVFSGDLGTTDDNPFRFRDTNGRLRVGMQFDAPLTRLRERNIYRESLIDYQQARRSYMAFVDRISALLRDTLRTIELNQMNFELRRAAVVLAIDQVDLTRLRLNQPPQPGQTSQFGATTARDLVDALTSLLNVQNDFLSVWVNQEVQRISLDFDLGTMQLDDRGLWIDPGPITSDWHPESEEVEPGHLMMPPLPEEDRESDLPILRENDLRAQQPQKDTTIRLVGHMDGPPAR